MWTGNDATDYFQKKWKEKMREQDGKKKNVETDEEVKVQLECDLDASEKARIFSNTKLYGSNS